MENPKQLIVKTLQNGSWWKKLPGCIVFIQESLKIPETHPAEDLILYASW